MELYILIDEKYLSHTVILVLGFREGKHQCEIVKFISMF
jgi:hypothetical protein